MKQLNPKMYRQCLGDERRVLAPEGHIHRRELISLSSPAELAQHRTYETCKQRLSLRIAKLSPLLYRHEGKGQKPKGTFPWPQPDSHRARVEAQREGCLCKISLIARNQERNDMLPLSGPGFFTSFNTLCPRGAQSPAQRLLSRPSLQASMSPQLCRCFPSSVCLMPCKNAQFLGNITRDQMHLKL